MFDIGPSIAVGDEEKLDLARNAAARLLEDLAEYDHPVAIFTASPYAVPGGDETPRPAALARVIDGLKALPRNNPKLERAISAYAATYTCAPKTRPSTSRAACATATLPTNTAAAMCAGPPAAILNSWWKTKRP